MHQRRGAGQHAPPIGQARARPRQQNNFWRIAYAALLFLLLFAILALAAWIIGEVLKLRSTGNKIKEDLKDPCPDPCFDPCPNVTLSCPDPPPVPEFEESDLCNDWNECTLDLLGTFNNESLGCKNLLRPNGFPCESECFAPPVNQTEANTTCHKGQCVGELCLGTCEDPGDCPMLNGTFESIECIDGACTYTNVLVPGGPLVDCSADMFQRTCECAIAEEPLRDCLVTDVLCGELLVKKRQPITTNWFILCTYSFFCALPKTVPFFP